MTGTAFELAMPIQPQSPIESQGSVRQTVRLRNVLQSKVGLRKLVAVLVILVMLAIIVVRVRTTLGEKSVLVLASIRDQGRMGHVILFVGVSCSHNVFFKIMHNFFTADWACAGWLLVANVAFFIPGNLSRNHYFFDTSSVLQASLHFALRKEFCSDSSQDLFGAGSAAQ